MKVIHDFEELHLDVRFFSNSLAFDPAEEEWLDGGARLTLRL